jgi:hypothetical protein
MVNAMEVAMANSTEPVEERRSGGSFSIAEWCRHRRLSVSMFYKLDAMGRAPSTIRVGRRRTVTHEADAAWAAANEGASAA